MKPKTNEKQETQISLIKRLTQKQLTYPNYEREKELRRAEGRRLREFHKEEKKEK